MDKKLVSLIYVFKSKSVCITYDTKWKNDDLVDDPENEKYFEDVTKLLAFDEVGKFQMTKDESSGFWDLIEPRLVGIYEGAPNCGPIEYFIIKYSLDGEEHDFVMRFESGDGYAIVRCDNE